VLDPKDERSLPEEISRGGVRLTRAVLLLKTSCFFAVLGFWVAAFFAAFFFPATFLLPPAFFFAAVFFFAMMIRVSLNSA
jgi:hypothetical protein